VLSLTTIIALAILPGGLHAQARTPDDRLVSARDAAEAGREAVLAREFVRGAEALERALELGDTDPRTRLYLGAALWETGELERSEAVYREALAAAGPGRGAFLPLHQLGRLLLWQGRADEAVAPLERAVRLSPSAADTQLALARALSESGRGDDALAAYRRAVELAPDSFHAHWGLAQELLRAAREGDASARAEAAQVLETYHELYRADQLRTRETGLLDAQLAAADLALARGDREAAVAALERAVALAPERQDLALLLAEQRLALPAGDVSGEMPDESEEP
jgi:cytochrome c-type biogenesis protein CcmH/NrfG